MTRALWSVGDVRRALETKDRILTIGRQSPDPRTMAFALLMASVLYQLIGDPKDGLAAAEEGIAVCDEHSILQERAWITTSRGWALTASGRMEEGIGEINTSIAMRRRMNADLDLPYAFAQLAEAYIKQGEIGRARTTLADGLELSRNDDDLWYQSELYRLLGESAMAADTSADPLDESLKSKVTSDDTEAREGMAESYFRRAVEIAKEQGGKSFELRAANSLARLLIIQGRSDEARGLLEDIRRQFENQIVTPDLATADKLLASLRSSPEAHS
jgi:tetratricopeptide (TPR) repeat protein